MTDAPVTAPAAAYGVVVGYLHPSLLARPAPPAGVAVMVTGVDRVETRWELPASTAQWLIRTLASDRRVRRVRYDHYGHPAG